MESGASVCCRCHVLTVLFAYCLSCPRLHLLTVSVACIAAVQLLSSHFIAASSMCGILGVIGVWRGAETIRPRVLERVRRLRHRGPDWSGVYCNGKNILAHERLAIVDVESGDQPLFNSTRSLALAVNGEIYNHKALEQTLTSPSPFLTHSDCEIILHLYEQLGPSHEAVCSLLNSLNGIFAFILLDEATGEHLIARDHMGIVPLYTGRDAEGSLWVASELKALVDICVTFEDFPPGHYMNRSGELRAWYTPAWHDESFISSAPLDLARLRTELEEAVRRQLMSDVPYGVLLSGGLDSSLIAAIAAGICANRVEDEGKSGAWWPRLHSFSVGLHDSPDLKMARIVAKQIGTVHHEFIFTVQEGLDAISSVIYHLETYDVTTIRAATPMFLMSRKIKCLGVKMVLSGEGSDEIFGGYLYFHKCPDREEMQRETVRKLKSLSKFDCLRANKSTAAWGVEARVPFLDRQFLDFAMTGIDAKDKLCGRSGDGRIEKHILRKAFEGLLPPTILWRQKEQMSDGVGYGWIDSIKQRAEAAVSDAEYQSRQFRFPINTPATKEAYYIRSIFDSHFPHQSAAQCVPGGPSVACSTSAAILWDASFQQMADCSGRSVAGVHENAYDDNRRREEGSKGGAVDVTQMHRINAAAEKDTQQQPPIKNGSS